MGQVCQVGCAALQKGLSMAGPAHSEGIPGCVDAYCEVQVSQLSNNLQQYIRKCYDGMW
jgi:hypothetical protein